MNTDFLLWLLRISNFSFHHSESICAFPSDDLNEDYSNFIIGHEDTEFVGVSQPIYAFEKDIEFHFDFDVKISVRQDVNINDYIIDFNLSYLVNEHNIPTLILNHTSSFNMQISTFKEMKDVFEFQDYLTGNIFARPFFSKLRLQLERLWLDNNQKVKKVKEIKI